MRRRQLVVVLAAVTLFCVVSGLVAMFIRDDVLFDPVAEKIQALDAAEAQWAKQHVTHYRLVIRNVSVLDDCRQDLEVKNEIAITTYENSCSQFGITHPAIVISDLFRELDEHVRQIGWFNGPGCDVIVASAKFDTRFGYPSEVNIHLEKIKPANIGVLNYLRNHPPFYHEECYKDGFLGPHYIVESLDVLP